MCCLLEPDYNYQKITAWDKKPPKITYSVCAQYDVIRHGSLWSMPASAGQGKSTLWWDFLLLLQAVFQKDHHLRRGERVHVLWEVCGGTLGEEDVPSL